MSESLKSSLGLTPAESDQMIDTLSPGFAALVADYDATKYPEDAYQMLVRAFADPTQTSDGDIPRALQWKYGHWRKLNYPTAQRNLAARIAAQWRTFRLRRLNEPEAVFDYWIKDVGHAC